VPFCRHEHFVKSCIQRKNPVDYSPQQRGGALAERASASASSGAERRDRLALNRLLLPWFARLPGLPWPWLADRTLEQAQQLAEDGRVRFRAAQLPFDDRPA